MSFNVFSSTIANTCLSLEEFLDQIAKDYNLPADEMKSKYLYEDRTAFTKMIKKNKKKKNRKVTPYNIFLSDKEVISKLKGDNKKEINTKKGLLWNKFKEDKDIFGRYESIAQLENNNLIKKENRAPLLNNWDNYKDNVSNIIDNKDDFDLEKSLAALKISV